MAISINLRDKHDARAKELGFADRHAMRKAISHIAETLGEEKYMELSSENLEIVLRVLAQLNNETQ